MLDTERIWAAFFCEAIRNGAWSPDDPRIAAMIPEFDVVVGIWPDADAPAGVLMLPVKGFEEWTKPTKDDLRVTSIPVRDRAAALALQARYGSSFWGHEAPVRRPSGEPGLVFRRLHVVRGDDDENSA